jgi:hypothetical protein
VWPTGGPRPDVANVSIPGSGATASLVTVKPGARGRVNITNDLGAAHCVVDVVGYFRSTAAGRLQAQAPKRVLDTRSGLGGRKGAFGAATAFAVKVRGVAGVPLTAHSVVVNVTAYAPTAAGGLVVWPSGVRRPAASSMSFGAKRTTTNLVFAKIGADGKIAVYNSAGATHVFVDVVGWFAATARGRFTPLAPGRLLDTRPDTVAPAGPASVTRVLVRGRGGVPSAGASTVLLNVTAKAPTAATNLTVYPSGTTKPALVNIVARAGVDTTGTVLCRLGTDGKVVVVNSAGTTDLVVDVVGWFTS